MMRPIPADAAVREHADALRARLVARLEEARANSDSNTYTAMFDGTRREPWAHHMAVFALLSQLSPRPHGPEGGRERLRMQFSPDVGRLGSNAIPLFWGYMALARQVALGLDDADARTQLAAAERELDRFRSSAEPGGWSIFLDEPQMRPDAYTTTMALMALLEARRAGLPWSGSAGTRDGLIHASFDWLVGHFNAGANPPGWQAGGSSPGESADGLTLQVYGRLLDAEREAGLRIPEAIAREIPRHLDRVDGRNAEFPVAGGELTYAQGPPRERSEGINFLWHPWAIDGAVRWSIRNAGSPLSTQARVGIRRPLGHLVLDRGDQTVANATKQFTFSASETLYALTAIPPKETP
jgi:hypothetical protein